MELSIFLAKLLGLYFLIVAAVLVLRKEEFKVTVAEIVASRGLLAYSGVMSLLLGLAIVIAHPVFEFNWKGLITLFGLLLIVRGFVRLSFPGFVKKRALALFNKRYLVLVLILLVAGLYLTYSGFTA